MKIFHALFRKNMPGDGGVYVVGIIGLIMAASYLMAGGLLPEIERNPENPEHVQIDNTAVAANRDSLQLVNLQPVPSPTPTSLPTPTGIPTITTGPGTPTPTTPLPTPPEACLNKTVISLLLDVSTSMNNSNKLDRLNTALDSFVDNLEDDTVVGAVQFAGLASFPNGNGSSTLLPYTRYGSNKTQVRNALTNLTTHTTSGTDGTYIRSAFQRSINNINAVRSQYESQGYNFATILFTDGIPETQFASDSPCEVEYFNPYLCFAQSQDPRSDLTNTMKSISDKVYAIGLYSGQRESQARGEAQVLLRDIASNSSYATDTSNPSALTGLFEDAITSVCN